MKRGKNLKSSNCAALLIVSYLISGACFSQTELQETIDKPAQDPDSAVLDLSVSNFEKQQGILVVSVYNDGDKWLSEDKVAEQRLALSESMSATDENDSTGVIKLRLELPIGEYAVSVYHDLNSNGKLDSNFIGIPKEPAAVSNNAPARFGPPKYRDAKFTLTKTGVEQDIRFK